jgi:AAHS family 4-hydroxybenzoate transporter-like MFS transporter
VTQHQTLDISQLIERQKVGFFAVLLILSTWIVMLTDGYELGAMAFAAPALVKAWHVERAALGPIFGASIVGIMVGSFLFGYIGDWLGRKRAIMLGVLWYGTLTLVTIWATSLDHLLWLRFAAGIGVGGAVPNAFVLVSESAPKRLRATWVTLMFTGYTLGAGLGGLVSVALVPQYGWQSVFLVGGVAPLMVGAVLWFVMPESARYLVLKGRGRSEVIAVVRLLSPGVEIGPNTQFIVSDEPVIQKFSPRMLFAGNLRLVTPILWLAYIANSMTLFFLQSWLPVLIEGVGVLPKQAALLTTLFSVGGTVGGLVMMRFVDKRGVVLIMLLPLIGFPLVASLGMGLDVLKLMCAVFGVGFCVAGTQSGLNAVASMIYPTAFRSKGTGSALGIAKIGSFSGPIIGGALLGAHLPVSQLFHAAAVPVCIVALLAFGLNRVYRPNLDAEAFAAHDAMASLNATDRAPSLLAKHPTPARRKGI